MRRQRTCGKASSIELHINTVSCEMNRAMRAIPVISALILIPTLIGQMPGMNNPLGYLWQVAAIIPMLAVGWIFFKLGRLR